MIFKKTLIYIYKKISSFYVLLFGRKEMQFFNDIIFSLSLDAKGFKNYGDFIKTGEENFIKIIKNEINFSIDIGANIGKYTKLILQNTNSKVISFEPLPEAFYELEKIKLEYPDRLETYNIAIGMKNDRLDLFYSGPKSEKASLIPNLNKLSFIRNENKNKISVDVKTLDSFENYFNDKKIDFIKIDTEGYEYEVLKGAEKILKLHKPKFIQIEFNWHQLIRNQTLYNLSNLLDLYEVFRILPNGDKLILVDPSRPENNIYHLSNYVFIRNDLSYNFK
ncbi:FkbM family methyltransferase [Candidatus Pelagibacter sp.]|nr:FkbM family methyltransferase [Candidatus Pelagibacter sp.]